MQHRCSCFLVLALFQQTGFSLSWNSERLKSPAFISGTDGKGGSRSLYPGVHMVCGCHESRSWQHQFAAGPEPTGPTALPFPHPCCKPGVAAEKNWVCGNITSPLHKRQPSFSLCRRLLVLQQRTQQCTYTTHCSSLTPSLTLSCKNGWDCTNKGFIQDKWWKSRSSAHSLCGRRGHAGLACSHLCRHVRWTWIF